MKILQKHCSEKKTLFPAVVLLLKYKTTSSPRLKHIIINQTWMTTDSKQDTAFIVFVQQKLQSTRNKMTGNSEKVTQRNHMKGLGSLWKGTFLWERLKVTEFYQRFWRCKSDFMWSRGVLHGTRSFIPSYRTAWFCRARETKGKRWTPEPRMPPKQIKQHSFHQYPILRQSFTFSVYFSTCMPAFPLLLLSCTDYGYQVLVQSFS